MQIKYAYLIFEAPYPIRRMDGDFLFDDSTKLGFQSLEEQFNQATITYWAEWLGSVTWEDLKQHRLILSSYAATQDPDVLDGENEALKEKLVKIFRVLPIAGPLQSYASEAYLITGKGVFEHETLTVQILVFCKGEFLDPSTLLRCEIMDRYAEWARESMPIPAFLEECKRIFTLTEKYFSDPDSCRQLVESHRSINEAFYGTQLEFKIPNLVRAIESLVHCRGYQQFAQRVISLIGLPDQSLPFSISTDTPTLLEIYIHCAVHVFMASRLNIPSGRRDSPSMMNLSVVMNFWLNGLLDECSSVLCPTIRSFRPAAIATPSKRPGIMRRFTPIRLSNLRDLHDSDHAELILDIPNGHFGSHILLD